MTREYITSHGTFVNETNVRQEVLSGGVFVNETSDSAGAPASINLAASLTATSVLSAAFPGPTTVTLNYVTDTFTGTAGALVTARSGEVGATWNKMSAFLGSTPHIDATGGRSYSVDTSESLLFASAPTPVDGETVELLFDTLTDIGEVGVGLRVTPTSGYFARLNGGTLAIVRITGGTQTMTALTLDQGGTSVAKTNSVGPHSLKFSASGTGASVALSAYYDNVLLASATDTSASRLTALGTIGLLQGGAIGTDTTGHHVSSVNASVTVGASATVFTAGLFTDGQIVQRQSGVGTITAQVFYANVAPTGIDARLVTYGTNTALTGFDWSTKVASPTGGSATISFANVPQGGMYDIQVRNTGNTSVVTTLGKRGVGDIVPIIGQSNGYRQFRTGDSTLTPDSRLSIYGNVASGFWMPPDSSSMNGAIATGNAIIAATGVPVAMLDYAWDGSGLLISNLGGQWLSSATSASNNAYTAFKSAVTAIGGKIAAAIWHQGSTEAKLQSSLATVDQGQTGYYNGLTSLFNMIRSDFGNPNLPIIIGLEGNRTVTPPTDAQVEMIRRAQAQKAAETNFYRVERQDLPLVDGAHHTAGGFTSLGQRQANAVKFAFGLTTKYRGPRIVSAAGVSSTVYDLTLVHDSGTDFTPTSGITGLRAVDGTTDVAISSAVHNSATTIRVTLASAPANQPTFYSLYGTAPDVSNVAKDNSTLSLPLEYNGAGITASAGRVFSVTLGDASGPAANLSNLSIRCYDRPGGALVYTTDVGTTDASGTVSVTASSSTMSAGDTGDMSVRGADGRHWNGPVQVT
jgi:hypothetical protein